MHALDLPLTAMVKALQSGTTTATELVTEALRRVAKRDSTVRAFVTLSADAALQAAAETDRRRAGGASLPPFAGIPFAAKDNFCTAGLRTTCCSEMLADFVPPYTATAVARLQSEGFVLLGKTNMDEFAMGATTTHSVFGATRNPLCPSRLAGGSSGGSAAAVAAGFVPLALGSDTGGSVREPAACCGVVGMKPTYGCISRYGLVSYASSLDTVGLLTRTAEDSRAVLPLLCGSDGFDATVTDTPFKAALPLCGLRVAVPDTLPLCDEQTAAVVRAAAEALTGAGCCPVRVSPSWLRDAAAVYEVIAFSEASLNLARYDGVRYGFRAPDADSVNALYRNSRARLGEVVRARILFGTAMLLGENRQRFVTHAQRLRTGLIRELDALFEACDVLLLPTLCAPAPRPEDGEAPCQPYAVLPSLCGLPAVSVPFGTVCGGTLPGAVTLTGRACSEETLYRVASALQALREGVM